MMISLLAFVGVSALVGRAGLRASATTTPQTADRLDTAGRQAAQGRRRPPTSCARRAFESDKKSLLELLTPNFLSLQKIFEQADCHIKPSTLFGIGLVLAALGATGELAGASAVVLRPGRRPGAVHASRSLWLLNKRPHAAEEVRGPAARRPGTGRPGPAGRPLAWRPACTWSPRKCRRRSPTSSAGSTRSRTSASRSRTRCESMCDRVPNLDLRFFVTTRGDPAADRRRPGGDPRQDRLRHPRALPHPGPGQGADRRRPASRRRADRPAVRPVPVMLHIKPDYVEMLWTTRWASR